MAAFSAKHHRHPRKLRVASTISGDKGGTGKSVVAAALSYILSQSHGPALLVDLGGGDSSTLALGRSPRAQVSVEDFLSDRAGLQEVILESGLSSRLAVVSSRSPVILNLNPERLAELLERGGAEVDYIILDFPAYSAGPLDLVLENSDKVLVVATPSKLVLDRLRTWLEAKHSVAPSHKLTGVLNMYLPATGSWKRTLLSLVNKVLTLSYDAALTFAHTRNIAEAIICASKSTRRELRELASEIFRPG